MAPVPRLGRGGEVASLAGTNVGQSTNVGTEDSLRANLVFNPDAGVGGVFDEKPGAGRAQAAHFHEAVESHQFEIAIAMGLAKAGVLEQIPRWIAGFTSGTEAAYLAGYRAYTAREIMELVLHGSNKPLGNPIGQWELARDFTVYASVISNLAKLFYFTDRPPTASDGVGAAINVGKDVAAARASIWAGAKSGAAIGSKLPWKAVGTVGGFVVGGGVAFVTGYTVDQFIQAIKAQLLPSDQTAK